MEETQNLDQPENKKEIPPKDAADKDKKENENSDVEEIFKEMPPKIRSTFFSMMQSSSREMATHPLFDKFDSNHINKFLDYLQEDDKNIYKYKSSNRFFHVFYSILAVSVLVFLLIFLLPTDRDLLIEILQVSIIFMAGVGSGYGIKSYQNKKK